MAHRAKTEQCVLFYVPSRSINLTLLILNCSAHTLQSKVKRQNVYLCQKVQHRYKTNLSPVMDSAIRTGAHLLPPIYLILYPDTHLTPLHPKSLTSNQLQDIYYLIERIDYGVPAYLYVYFLMLQNISILLLTLLYFLIQNLALVTKTLMSQSPG